MPVAVNVRESPAALASSVFVPASVPSVHEVTVAIPLASVVWLPPFRLPPPPVTVNVTGTPATGLPAASLRSTLGATATTVFTTASCASPAAESSCVGALPSAIMSNVTGLPLSPAAVA